MIKRILLIFLLGLGFLVSKAQVGQFERVFVNQNFVPPQDTIINPVRIGELRFRQQDTSIYASISLSGRKWYKAVSGGVIGSSANNYVTGINFNSGNGIFSLSRLGLPTLTTTIPIPVYNGSETIIQAGSGGISVAGIGTTGNPYIISATQDGNNYPVAMTYTGGVLSLQRNGLTTITVPIPASENNYPTSLQYSGTTLTLARNGLAPLSTTIPQDGNNYPTSLAYINGVLTMNRAGLPALTANIPALDTNVVSTRANRQKGLDSLGALTKARVFLSGDSSISVTRRTGLLADTIDIRSADTLVETVFISSGNTVTIDYIEGIDGDTIDLNVSVGPGAIDTNVLSTKAWNQKGLDSLGALTKARYYFSSDNSVGVQRKTGLLQDSIDITSLDTTVSVFFMSGDNSVTIDYRQGELEDTFDLRVTVPEGVGDNWGSQFAYTNNTILGNGLATNPLAIDTTSMFFTRWATKQYVKDSLITFYTGDGNIPTNRNVGIGTNELRFFTTDGSQLRMSQSNGLRYNGIIGAALFPILRVQNNDLALLSGLASGSTGGIRVISGVGNFGAADDSVRVSSFYSNNTVNGVFAQSLINLDGFTGIINARDSIVFGINSLPLPRLVYQRYSPILSPYQLVHKFYTDSAVNTRHLNMLFQDEGVALGITGTTTVVNFTGNGVTSSRVGNTVTVNIPGATGGAGGTVTSVGLTMPPAFTVGSSPVTTSGTLSVTANGNTGQYITGAGTLATFPTIPTYDGSETKLQQGANISISGLGTIGSPYVISGDSGTVTSVNFTAPPAFTVLGTPITGAGTIQLTAAGNSTQYIRGDGTLASFPAIPTYDGSETKIVQGSNVTITGLGTVASPYVINSTASGGGSGTVTSVGLSAFSGINVSNTPITTAGTIALSTTLNGILYGTGSGFAAGTVTAPLVFSAGNLSMTQSGAASNGWLSSANWNTFNSKQQAIQFQDEWVNRGTNGGISRVNFIGAGVTAVDSSGTLKVTIPGAAADQNNYVTGASIAGGVLTINRLGLADVTTSFSTTAVPEGTNQYFTTLRARQSLSQGAGINYNQTTGVITTTIGAKNGITKTGDTLKLGGTLLEDTYIATEKVLSIGGSVGTILYSDNIAKLKTATVNIGGYFNSGTFNFFVNSQSGTGRYSGMSFDTARVNLHVPDSSSNYTRILTLNSLTGQLGHRDAASFIRGTSPVQVNWAGNYYQISMPAASSITNGYLASSDFSFFESKQRPLLFQDEGSSLGTAGSKGIVNFIGNGVTATQNGDTVKVTIPAGSFAGKVVPSLNSGWAVAQEENSNQDINEVLKVGHTTDNEYRTITLNGVYYRSKSSFTFGIWNTVATIPAAYRPNVIIEVPLPRFGTADPYETNTGFTFYDNWKYNWAGARILPTGEIQVNILTDDALNNYCQHAETNVAQVLFPLHVTYFIQSISAVTEK